MQAGKAEKAKKQKSVSVGDKNWQLGGNRNESEAKKG